MSKIDSEQYRILLNNFNTIWKRIQPYLKSRRLTSNTDLIEGYRRDIVETFNQFIGYVADCYSFESFRKQQELTIVVQKAKDKVIVAFDILNLVYEFSANNFEQINTNKITFKETLGEVDENLVDKYDSFVNESENETDSDSDTEQNLDDPARANEFLNDNGQQIDENIGENARNFEQENNARVNEPSLENIAMAQSPSDFLKVVNPIINYKFNGDPLKLESFVSDIELVYELADPANRVLCFKLIKSKLEAKALECLPEGCNTVQGIIDAMKANIRPESSSVIEGRMLSLKLTKSDFSKFADEAEKLAEAFRRSSIVEGISKAKAQEMTIDKTVKLCRETARSDIVKSVLAGKTFTDPRDVVAKFITECDQAKKEQREKDLRAPKPQNSNKNGKKFNKFDAKQSNSRGKFKKPG